MTLAFVLPAVAALVAAATVGAAPQRLQPSTATRILTAAIVFSSTAAIAAITAVAVAYVTQLPRLAEAIGWCQAMVSHHDRIPPELGIPALITLVAMAVAAVRAILCRRRLTASSRSAEGVEIVTSGTPIAYAVPGRPGHVVVSVGMLRCLDADERRVLFAHEQAHLTHHHHRFLGVAEVAAATIPLLRPLLARLRFATERWADEVAARQVGDRRLVARAIARAALAGQSPDAALAFSASGVVARVEALLDSRRPAPWLGATFVALLVGVVATGAAGSGIQVHHLVALLDHLCH